MAEDRAKQVYKRTLAGFVPANGEADAFFRAVKAGEMVELLGKRPRNLKWHNLYFAAVDLLFDNQDRYTSKDEFLAAIKVALGHCDYLTLKNGERVAIPKSISFAKMDATAWEAFWSRFCDLVETKILPGVKREQLERELREMTAA
jgi:hypothetical protein